jgi:hypothetical protein
MIYTSPEALVLSMKHLSVPVLQVSQSANLEKENKRCR